MKQRYQSPAWISAAMDDAGLTPHEFRVLAHVCRRAGDGANGRGCDASVASMAEACKIHPDRLRQMLKKLGAIGWLVAEARPGKATAYWPAFPAGDPSIECLPLPLAIEGGDPLAIEGDEGNPEGKPMKGTRVDTVHPADGCERGSQSTAGAKGHPPPNAGPASVYDIFEEDARAWARQFHMLEGRSAESALAMFPLEDVEAWAVDWLVTMQARGWKLGGDPVANPRAALRGYLRKAAAVRSKRFRELSSPNPPIPNHHLGYRTSSRVNAADLPNLPEDEFNSQSDIPF